MVGRARNSSARWHGNWTSSSERGSEKLQAALKNVKDFKEGPVARAIMKAAHKSIGSGDACSRTFLSKHKLCMTSSAFYCSVETKKKTKRS